LGADSFRGFEYGGIGPRDTSTGDALGGRRYWMATAESLFPIGLPNEFGVKGALFADVGSLWDSSYKGHRFVRDSHFIRAAVGFGIAWTSPMGPIRLDYSFPVRKDKGDDTQRILLSFRTKL
jgi:outer membrane protein insertion porin family